MHVLRYNYFDTIYHEHLDYHHAYPLTKFLKKIGFSVLNISTNKIQGGSIRILCKKESKHYVYNQAKNFLNKERMSIIFNKNFLSRWEHKVYNNCFNLNQLIKEKINLGYKVIGYGAPTKAVLLSKLSKFDKNHLQLTVEDNIKKINKFIPGTAIKIIDAKFLKSINPKYILLFAWNFYSDISKTLKQKFKKNKIFVIVPLPKMKIIKL